MQKILAIFAKLPEWAQAITALITALSVLALAVATVLRAVNAFVGSPKVEKAAQVADKFGNEYAHKALAFIGALITKLPSLVAKTPPASVLVLSLALGAPSVEGCAFFKDPKSQADLAALAKEESACLIGEMVAGVPAKDAIVDCGLQGRSEILAIVADLWRIYVGANQRATAAMAARAKPSASAAPSASAGK